MAMPNYKQFAKEINELPQILEINIYEKLKHVIIKSHLIEYDIFSNIMGIAEGNNFELISISAENDKLVIIFKDKTLI